MRALVFFLILANLLFFAYTQGYLGTAEAPDALRIEQQVHPERLRLLARDGEGGKALAAPIAPAPVAAPDEAPPAAVAAPEARPAAPPPEKKPDPVPEPVPAKPASAEAAQACLLLTGLKEDEAARLAAQASAANLAVSQRSEGGWWVFLPPQADKKGAEKKAGELQRLGVAEFFVVNEGPQKYAISLGIFSREEAAQRRLEQLRGQGVRSARVGQRSLEGARRLLEVKGSDSDLAALRKALPAGSVVRDCP